MRGVDGSQGNIPIAVLRELPLKDRLRQEGIAFRGSGFRQPVKNVVFANGDAEAGKQGRAILPSYKNAVRQSSGGTAAKSRQGAFFPEGYGFPVFTILAIFQQEGDASQGITFGVNLLDLNGTYLLPVGDAIEAGTGYRVSLSILCKVNGEYLVA